MRDNTNVIFTANSAFGLCLILKVCVWRGAVKVFSVTSPVHLSPVQGPVLKVPEGGGNWMRIEAFRKEPILKAFELLTKICVFASDKSSRGCTSSAKVLFTFSYG